MLTIRIILKVLPWVIAMVLAGVLVVFLHANGTFQSQQAQTIITQNTILKEVEAMGKLELVKYNFQDIKELERKESWQKYFLGIINWGEARIALISAGSAVGCIDLTRIGEQDVKVSGDTVYLKLPPPELCYYKLDMEKTRIYQFTTEWKVDREQFIQEGYRKAEQRIREAALESGILEQTAQNAELILGPMLEKVSGKPVVFVKRPEDVVSGSSHLLNEK